MKYLVVLFVLLVPITSFAQFNSFLSPFSPEKVLVELSPEFPAPREIVTARVVDLSYEDLSRAEIVWKVDDVEKKRGIGEQIFQFQAPETGREMEVFAIINKSENETIAGFTKIRTADLDLIYEANTYTPPLYKGRSLFVPQAQLNVAAVANIIENGVRIPKSQIIYNWYENNNFIKDASGVGRDSFRVQGDVLLRPLQISVVVESLNSNAKAKKKISIVAANPKVVMYENNPIYGSIFEKALTGTFNFDREEVGITAVPYFFTTPSRNSDTLKYSWSENGKEIGGGGLGSFINYLNPNREKSGVSNLGVNIENNVRFLQSDNESFKINVLGNQQSGTIKTNETSAF